MKSIKDQAGNLWGLIGSRALSNLVKPSDAQSPFARPSDIWVMEL